ncbi:hypothetical protein LBMAG33_4550 [Candidatus Levyibacteriota bacterium]|nr:hypothetical protein [Candidatus Levybacteria bacterium]GDX62145.1 hypothetical protein LBMAG33_4550 [Candidatus Levybacteria bacterium]
MFEHQNSKGHLKRRKNKRQIRRQQEPGHLTGAFAKKIKQMLGAL